MADRYLLESGSPDGYLLEDSSGVLILEVQTGSAIEDGSSDGFWAGFQRGVVGVVLAAAAALPVQAAQRQVAQPQDEYPYATGNGVSYGGMRNHRAQASPMVFHWEQGDDFPAQAAPTFVEEQEFQPPIVKAEFKLQGPNWDDPFPTTWQVEEDYSWSYWLAPQPAIQQPGRAQEDIVPQPVATVLDEDYLWGYLTAPQPIIQQPPSAQEEPVVPTSIGFDEEAHQPPVFLPKPLFKVWEVEDERPTQVTFTPTEEDWNLLYTSKDSWTYIIWATTEDIVPQPAPSQGGGVLHDPVRVLRWYQEDDLPVTAATLGIDEESWIPSPIPVQPGKWLEAQHQDEPIPSIAEESDWFNPVIPATYKIPDPWQDEEIVPQPAFVEDEYYQQPPWIVPAPINRVETYQDEVPPPPPPLEVFEEYWIQPPYPTNLPNPTAWQIRIDIDEEFPELVEPPKKVEILGGDPGPKKKRKHPREEVKELVEEVLRPAEPAPSLPEPLQPVAKAILAPVSSVLISPPELVAPEINEGALEPEDDPDIEDLITLFHLGLL